MKGKDLLTLSELSKEDIMKIIDMSLEFKEKRNEHFGNNFLKSKQIALLFEKPSTRTRVSFQVAVNELGGNAIVLSSSELQLGRGETIEDTAMVLERYVQCIMARVNSHQSLVKLSQCTSIPVVNGLSDLYHPLQVLADLMTLKEKFGTLKGLKVSWIGDGTNVCNSWLIGAALTGINFVAATPEGYEPNDEAIAIAKQLAEKSGVSIETIHDPDEAAEGADCIMTDTFVSMGLEKEREERLKVFLPRFQVNKRLFTLAKRNAVFMHCLPAHRGEEVTADVIDGKSSVVFDQAENRLHTSKSVLYFLMTRT